MRVIAQIVPIIVAMGTFWLLVPSMRVGEISILFGLAIITGAFVVGVVLVVVAVGAVSGTPPSQWLAIWKQLYRGQVKNDG